MTPAHSNEKYAKSIIAALLVAMAPHILTMPVWITVWVLACWAYVIWGGKYGLPNLSSRQCNLLALVGLGTVLMTNRHLGGAFYLGLLAIMSGLKPMEMHTHRDRMVTVFLAYYIVITALFQKETLAITLYMIFSVVMTTAVLIHINHPQSGLKSNLKLAARIIVQAVPLMIILFVFFPRIQGSLWGIARSGVARTGFADRIQLGDVSQLVQDDSVAFHVDFRQQIPSADKLYWRGIVFQRFNGRGWEMVKRPPRDNQTIIGRNSVDYVVTIEPHGRHWVFALDMPVDVQGAGQPRVDQTVRIRMNIERKIRVRLRSLLVYNTGPLDEWDQIYLDLSGTHNPRSRGLALEWMAQGLSPEQIVDAALDFLRDNQFVYTLKPPLLGRHVIDDFLFNARRGYCEHFASAFVFLMRAAGLPARVVGGYLGGETNPFGNFLVVHQADAHAWAEVWLEKKGWSRVDPTSIVAPERITRGVTGALADDELPSFLTSGRFGKISALWRDLRFGWDAVSIQWDIWFSGYSYFEQQALLSKLGIDTFQWMGQVKFLLMMIALVMLAAVAWFIRYLIKIDRHQDALAAQYHRFCRKLEALGLPQRQPHEGPLDYARRVGHISAELREPVNEITALYVRMRYDRDVVDPDSMRKIKSKINGLNRYRLFKGSFR